MISLVATYREVWQQSQKPGGERNFFDHFIYRRLSTLFLCFIKDTHFSPNLITTVSVMLSLAAGLLYILVDTGVLYYLAVLFMMMSLVTDTMDGQYARLTGQSSEFGGWYDKISDSMKYIILFVSLSLGAWLNRSIEHQWLFNNITILHEVPELILVAGMIIIGQLYLIYHIHGTRYHLTFNPGTMVNLSTYRTRYHFGIESTLYTLFLIFLLFKQVYWLYTFLICALPFAWIYPFYRTWQQSRSITGS